MQTLLVSNFNSKDLNFVRSSGIFDMSSFTIHFFKSLVFPEISFLDIFRLWLRLEKFLATDVKAQRLGALSMQRELLLEILISDERNIFLTKYFDRSKLRL